MSLSEIHIIGARTQELLVSAEACPALAAAGVRLCGVSDTAAPYRMERPALPFGEVLGVLAGEGRVWLEGEGWRTVGAGECYLAPRGSAQGFFPAPGRRWRIAWVHYVETTPESERVLARGAATVVAGDAEPLAEAIRRLHTEVLGANDAAMAAQLAGWVHLCGRRLARRPEAGRGDERLRRLWTRVDAELGEPWDLAALAKSAGLSGEHLRRLCQAELGRSPMAELTRLRMRRAGLLLRSTPSKVEAVAAAVGYGSLYAFSAAFRREVGVPPSAWRSGTGRSL
ncbi:MAG: helix-turn-helix domain-containing protein [Opitutaceae bacterium]|jgi:AraC-like DNA-binding protein|nr:helix-turn-helix domain-containing protein [Opitutaceae bacterium]